MRTRHVWLIPPLGVGQCRQGYVLAWRRGNRGHEAQVIWVDERRDMQTVEWIPSVYLVPVRSERPASGGRGDS
ncbi:hypothetical protein [Nocardioides marmoriginsengisoli]|uniref:hypothetical protein n=1 Tax=Nocardioides marmoriginsengisoli TaxID=661483 RepID=UPI0011CE8766|nr:hypothetical protein [Nocardioides marmoriginsengisoli]